MKPSQNPRGVMAPVVTPFTSDLRPDAARLVRHCRWLLDNDVGLAVFGTNSEANSLTVAEKLELLDGADQPRADRPFASPLSGHVAAPGREHSTVLP